MRGYMASGYGNTFLDNAGIEGHKDLFTLFFPDLCPRHFHLRLVKHVLVDKERFERVQ